MNQEPVLTAAGLTAAVMSIVNVLVLFNVFVADAQQLAALNIAIGSIVGVGLAIWARMQVTPTSDPKLQAGTSVTVTDSSGNTTGATTV